MKKYFAALIIALLFSACSKNYYTPALYQNDIQNMVKPYSKDSVKHAFYATGTWLVHNAGDFKATGLARLGNLYYSQTLDGFNFSGGVLAFAGSYAKDSDNGSSTNNNAYSDNGFSKSFLGYGFNASLSGFIPFEHTDWRVLGADFVYTHESGSYALYRKNSIDDADHLFIRQRGMFTYGIFSEVVINHGDGVSLSLKMGLNKSTGEVGQIDHALFNNGAFSSSVSYKHMLFIGSLRFDPARLSGFVPDGLQLGAGYKF